MFKIAFFLILVIMSNLACAPYKSITTASVKSVNIENATPEQLRAAYRKASLILLKNTITAQDANKINNYKDYEKEIDNLIGSPDFINTMITYHQNFFEMSGREGNINLNEPANLAAYLIKNEMDFRKILTEPICISDSLTPVNCSTFTSINEQSAQAAGVITTQGYLKKWSSAFNFRRVERTLKAFACHGYPDESDRGVRAEDIEDRLAKFNSTTEKPVCYSCHRTMNPRAVLFYDFDISGKFNLKPNNNLVTKNADGGASTKLDLLKPGVQPIYHGQAVSSLKDYGAALANSEKFSDCVAVRFTNFALGRKFDERLPAQFNFVFDEIYKRDFNIKLFLKSILTNGAFVSIVAK